MQAPTVVGQNLIPADLTNNHVLAQLVHKQLVRKCMVHFTKY
jgi:hypothetical protein